MIVVDDLIKQAMKSRNQTELRAYKNLKAEMQIVQTAKNAKPYDEVAKVQLLSKMCKKLEDDISSFIEANREDLASEYRDELEILRKLLPEPVNESQIYFELVSWCRTNHFIQRFYTAIGYEEHCLIPKKEMGNAIKYLKSKFPQAEGKIISKIVKKCII